MRFYIILLAMYMSFIPQAYSTQADDWRSYLDATIGKSTYYLYDQAIKSSFSNWRKYRSLDLGSGSGDIVVDMISKGWDVTAVDTSERAKDILIERTKNLKGKLDFQLVDFSQVNLSGKYNLVTSFNSLPLSKKENLPTLIKNISAHMKKGSLLAVNFFGNDHTYVINESAFGVTENEVRQYLTDNGFKIIYYLNRIYNNTDNDNKRVHYDMIDVIAVKI